MSDLFALLANLKRTLAVAGNPLIVILVIRETVPVPASSLLASIRATLPAILACCEELVVAIEGNSSEHPRFGASFQIASAGPTRQRAPQMFNTLSAAFAHTQRLAPHDVLELQRHVLHLSFPPPARER
ncbi:MAG TPA: hypothetical protein VFK05_29515 [Polyangiaceae bacterium]|nr:hypothetical protein [Polyangiaceae bacterium]